MAKKKTSRDEELRQSEAALIAKFEARIRLPEDLDCEMQRWEDERKYVHTTAMLLDEEDAVGTNFILRNQYAALARIVPKDPAPRFAPRRYIPERGNEETPASFPEDAILYATTMEIILEFQQHKAGLKSILAGAAQDALTLPVAWIKMRTQEDFTRDPLGYGRNNDQLDLLARYERLRREYDAGEFTDTAAEYEELRILYQTVSADILKGLESRLQELQASDDAEISDDEIAQLESRVVELRENPEMLAQVSDLPEIARYVGFTYQQVDPEDIRWDWRVRRPEDLRYARWMAHRVYMTPAEIRDKWGVDDEELRGLLHRRVEGPTNSPTATTSVESDPEYGGKDPEERDRSSAGGGTDMDAPGRGTQLAVWEHWDRVQGRVFRWVQGTHKFLDNYVPEALPSRFFPFYPIIYNRVTGKMLGPSDTDLQQPLQDESNMLRTHDREARKSSHPRYLVGKGLIAKPEKQKFQDALPYEMIEVERPTDIKNSIQEIIPNTYDPRLYFRHDVISEMAQMARLPAAATGGGLEGVTATADAIANQAFAEGTDQRQGVIMAAYTAMCEAMAEINAQVMNLREAQEIAGPGAVWPEFSRQQILGMFVLDPDATPNDPQARKMELEAWMQFAQLSTQFGLPISPIPISKKFLELMGIRDNIGRYISIPALAAMNGLPATATGGAPASDPAAQPEAQGAFGSSGGSEGVTAPPSPSSIPNSPA